MPEITDLAGHEVVSKSKNSLFFSLLAGNSSLETGSTATATATILCNICCREQTIEPREAEYPPGFGEAYR